TVLKVAIGQRAAQQFKSHHGAGPFGFLDAIGGCRVRQPGNPIRYDPDEHSIAPRFQNTQSPKTGKLRIVGMREYGEDSSQAASPPAARQCLLRLTYTP